MVIIPEAIIEVLMEEFREWILKTWTGRIVLLSVSTLIAALFIYSIEKLVRW